mmetsp:Transcript_1845/g.1285  ORF Transcript_1845/g.1285 Transcript_1845/m.1285 type:complete len:229 (+) Transcript_1845:2134-2820(+)
MKSKYIATSALIISCIVLYLFRTQIWDHTVFFYNTITNKETVKEFVESFGSASPFIFIVLQILQVVFAPVPGEVTGFIGGYLFGTGKGFLYSSIGLTLGSFLNFALGRFLGKQYIRRRIPAKYLDKFDTALKGHGVIFVFILFIFPGFPKDYFCIFLGLSSLPYKIFLILACVGRMPGTLLLSLEGSYYFEELYWHVAVIFCVCIIAGGLAYKFKENIFRFIKKLDTN